jgi:hypothetical protein
MLELSVGGGTDTPERFAQLQESLTRLQADVASISGKLDALLKHAGIEYDPCDNLPEGVLEALRRGDQIEAIKLYREATGAGLKQARDFIEGIQR